MERNGESLGVDDGLSESTQASWDAYRVTISALAAVAKPTMTKSSEKSMQICRFIMPPLDVRDRRECISVASDLLIGLQFAGEKMQIMFLTVWVSNCTL
ncbi:protein of unknown function [Pseudodesulfovibrio profundus]|uniref:Uncharacterized protein n=1 Tax=Pseudodesulfovibrio profundus TaxID=57320 RepID=A0A2C8F7I7_9BACT|nr:protein of unknown function [Pseudodesulfovibrio profundus]